METHPDWLLGFVDETWWSRFAQPAVHSWREADQPLRLVEQTPRKDDREPKALACYGVLARWLAEGQRHERVWLRFVDGRPVSVITIQFLEWGCGQLESVGKRVWVVIWDNASWHISKAVRSWVRAHNQAVKHSGEGVRILICCLPIKSPWLNPIEPKWAHAKRRIVEPDRTLTAQEMADRICDAFDCIHEEHLSVPFPEKVS
jgi:transposase